jgi:hypothetical protein
MHIQTIENQAVSEYVNIPLVIPQERFGVCGVRGFAQFQSYW